MAGSALVLIVDDDDAVRFVTRQLFRANGYEVLAVGSGEAALAAWKYATPELVLLDVDMPDGMNGFETLSAMRIDPASATVPVIIFSASDPELHRDEAARRGAHAFVSKTARNWRDDLLSSAKTALAI